MCFRWKPHRRRHSTALTERLSVNKWEQTVANGVQTNRTFKDYKMPEQKSRSYLCHSYLIFQNWKSFHCAGHISPGNTFCLACTSYFFFIAILLHFLFLIMLAGWICYLKYKCRKSEPINTNGLQRDLDFTSKINQCFLERYIKWQV